MVQWVRLFVRAISQNIVQTSQYATQSFLDTILHLGFAQQYTTITIMKQNKKKQKNKLGPLVLCSTHAEYMKTLSGTFHT